MTAYDIFVGIVLTLIPFILGGIAAWLVLNKPSDKSTQLEVLLYDFANMAVAAAQQIYGVASPELKKKYAVDFLARIAPKFDPEAIDAAIEAAVYRLKQESK